MILSGVRKYSIGCVRLQIVHRYRLYTIVGYISLFVYKYRVCTFIGVLVNVVTLISFGTHSCFVNK